MKELQCFAHGRPGAWEAICIDLDIAVSGPSLEDVQDRLQRAIGNYIETALQEEPAVARKLLRRRAPLHVRVGHRFGIFVDRMRRVTRGEETTRFRVPCHV